MLPSIEAPLTVNRVCGHFETEMIRYRGPAELRMLQTAARSYFCKSCSELAVGWLSACAEPYAFDLPPLIGSAAQVSWATSLRKKAANKLLPVMTLAATNGGKIGASVWQVLCALFLQRQASFWIGERDMDYDQYYILREASYFAMGLTYGVQFNARSIFGRWKANSPHLIEDVRRRCPVSVLAVSA